MQFKLFSKDMTGLVRPYLATSDTLAYEYQASYLLLWREVEDIHIAMEDDTLLIQQRASGSYLMPLGKDPHHGVDLLVEYSKEVGRPLVFASVPKEHADIFDERFIVEDDRDDWDYIYRTGSLDKLAGRRYQAKRNHISHFDRDEAGYEVVGLTPDMKAECLEMDAFWAQKHQTFSKAVTEERMAIEKAFDHFDELGLMGIGIRCKGELAAFTIGEIVNGGREAVIHFEKGDTSYVGIYAKINQLFVHDYLQGTEYVNRQEDMGLEGLRKAKLSYHPDLMQEKVKAWLK